MCAGPAVKKWACELKAKLVRRADILSWLYSHHLVFKMNNAHIDKARGQMTSRLEIFIKTFAKQACAVAQWSGPIVK